MKPNLRTSKLRQLDFDDLIVMGLLYEGYTGKGISVFLGLTPPAISHRFSKYSAVFDGKDPFFIRGPSRRILSDYGKKLCHKAKRLLTLLLNDGGFLA